MDLASTTHLRAARFNSSKGEPRPQTIESPRKRRGARFPGGTGTDAKGHLMSVMSLTEAQQSEGWNGFLLARLPL